MTVPTCPLGQWNGLTVSALGLGYIGTSDFCGATPDDDTGSIATIHRVIELDISLLDTSDTITPIPGDAPDIELMAPEAAS
jgi:aryl-alcohol dehydrogenase-like predicted oxidoreductase